LTTMILASHPSDFRGKAPHPPPSERQTTSLPVRVNRQGCNF